MPARTSFNVGRYIRLIDSYQQPLIPAKNVGISPRMCAMCQGQGKLTVTPCEDCSGQGEFQHGNHTYCCKSCSGNGFGASAPGGEDDCQNCLGTGQNWLEPSILGSKKRPGYSASSGPIAVLRKIGGSISPDTVTDEGGLEVFVFSFHGGKGVLMPQLGEPLAFNQSDLFLPRESPGGVEYPAHPIAVSSGFQPPFLPPR